MHAGCHLPLGKIMILKIYSDSLLSPGNCSVYDHCHHSEGDEVPCGVGYLDGEDTTSVSLIRNEKK